ncbi:S-adenosylmethionine uptake transporter [Paracoccus sulfuroxidans]|uniref:S-adenosylmethionine uptake transporter n=1 Tax=Paracoccus sulfuroxidans TaxID=384678 RepID=A0A562NGI1_9RHOB|nr:S-adenosylmethionine uptake transporter [Paracoccus sulfuroxidans]
MAAGHLKGPLLALLSMGIYSTHDAIIKLLGETYPPLQILFFSALLSFPPLAVLMLRDPAHGNLRPRHPLLLFVRSTCIVIAGVAGFYAFSVLPLAQVYAILFTSPLFITLLSVPFLGEKVGLFRGLAVVTGLAGVMVVLRPGATPIHPGHIAALCASIASATAAIIVRRIGRTERTATLMLWPILGNFCVTGASLGFAYQPMPLVDLALTGVIGALGLTAAFFLILAYRAGAASLVAPMQYSQMLWATAYGWFFFQERLDAPTFIGAAMIMLAGGAILTREPKPQPGAPEIAGTRLRGEMVTTPRPGLLLRLLSGRK